MTRVGRSNCIVWSPTSCTYLSGNGPIVEGVHPPVADDCDPQNYARVPFHAVDCIVIELPEPSAFHHTSLRLLGAEHVQVASASPAVIDRLDEVPTRGPDPILPFLDGDGQFVPPTHFRGTVVTGFTQGPTLLGPIQPDGRTRLVVRRWPADVWDACRTVADIPLSDEVLIAASNAVAPGGGGRNRRA